MPISILISKTDTVSSFLRFINCDVHSCWPFGRDFCGQALNEEQKWQKWYWQKQLLTIEIVYISNHEALFSKEGKFGEELFFWVSAVLLVGKRSDCSFYFWNSMMLHALAKLGPGNTCIEPNPDINFSHELA